MEITEKKTISLNAWVGLYLAIISAGTLLRLAVKSAGLSADASTVISYGLTSLGMLLLVLAVTWKAGIDHAAALKRWRETLWGDLGISAALTAGLLSLVVLKYKFGLSDKIAPGMGETILSFVAGEGKPVYWTVAAYLFICVVTPVIEELFYRRLLYVSLRGKYSLPAAVILGGLLFSLQHIASLTITMIVGVAYCLVYEKTKRLSVTVYSHMMYNAVIITSVLYWPK